MTEQQRQQRFKVILAFALVYVFWGSTFLAIKVVVEHMPPTMMGAIRFLIAGPLMLAYCLFTGRRIAITRQDAPRMLLIGVLLLSGGNVVVGWAEKYVTSGLAALILAVTPIWVAIIEAWVLKSARLSLRGVLGLVLGTAGLLILLWPKMASMGEAGGKMQLYGALALVCAALSWTIGSLISKRVTFSVDAFAATGWEMLFAGMVNFLLAAMLGDVGKVEWTQDSVLGIAYLVTGGSLIGFTAYIWLLDNVATSKVATYAYVNPIVAVILGWLILNEQIDKFILAGSAVIIAGVILVTTSKVKAPAAGKLELAPVECEGD